MKIEATCETCERTFLLSQIGPHSDAPGRCPFCGARFARHYNSQLIEAVDAAEQAAIYFVQAFNRVRSMQTGFDLDVAGVLDDLARRVQDESVDPVAG